MGQSGNLTDRRRDQASIAGLLAAAMATPMATPRLDAEVLLARVLGRPRAYLIAHAEQTIDATAAAQYQALLTRRAQGEPVAYLTGEREFWSLALEVNPDVLIPRPETELAVERCLALRADPATIADLGTGSGAIALALALERPEWRIIATDRSAAALRVARANARRHALRNVEFLQGDWCAPLRAHRFDLLVSNPPYIAASDPALKALRFEPAAALSPGQTGMEALQRVVLQATAVLVSGGALVLEHGANQAADVALALVAAGFARVRCHSDLAGRARVTEAQWP